MVKNVLYFAMNSQLALPTEIARYILVCILDQLLISTKEIAHVMYIISVQIAGFSASTAHTATTCVVVTVDTMEVVALPFVMHP